MTEESSREARESEGGDDEELSMEAEDEDETVTSSSSVAKRNAHGELYFICLLYLVNI